MQNSLEQFTETTSQDAFALQNRKLLKVRLEAVTIQAKGGDAGERMYRAYGLANFAHDVLTQAQPALFKRGCDVGPLL